MMETAIALLAGVLSLPALALAGWRVGRRGQPKSQYPESDKMKSQKIPYGTAELRPRVRKAQIKRSIRRR